ncbi:MAG: hypothetical protein ACREIB_14375, partial [Pseudomonadota bacterium]
GDIRFDSFFQYAINFAYTVGPVALTGTIAIQSDAHFMCVETVYDVALTAAPAFGVGNLGAVPQLASGGCLVQLTDGGTQRAMQNIPVPASTLFGSAQRPFVWPFSHVFKANTSIGVLSTGVSAAAMVGTTVRYVFAGFKIPIGSMPELQL